MADRDEDHSRPPLGEEAARFRLRSAGYCVVCDRLVEQEPDGGCPAGHPAQAVGGSFALGSDEPVPRLPRFNLAAFALPFVWGPAHGQWAGAFFLPIWVFADNAIAAAGQSTIASAGAVVVVAGTLAFQAFFAKRANGLAWRRLCGRMAVPEFVRRQRVWAAACVPIALGLLAWKVA